MTVSTQYQPFTYKPGAAMAAEAIDWQFLESGQVRVVHIDAETGTETTLVAGDDYAVGGSGPDGSGTVTALAAWPVDDDFRIERDTELEQEYDLPPFEALSAASLEREIDRKVMALQELNYQLVDTRTRALMVPAGSVAPEVPDLADSGGMFLGLNATGDALVPLSGTGNDAALRTDLADIGGELVGVDDDMTLQEKLDALDTLLASAAATSLESRKRDKRTYATAARAFVPFAEVANVAVGDLVPMQDALPIASMRLHADWELHRVRTAALAGATPLAGPTSGIYFDEYLVHKPSVNSFGRQCVMHRAYYDGRYADWNVPVDQAGLIDNADYAARLCRQDLPYHSGNEGPAAYYTGPGHEHFYISEADMQMSHAGKAGNLTSTANWAVGEKLYGNSATIEMPTIKLGMYQKTYANNPITSTNGSGVVRINDPGHGYATGRKIELAGAVGFNGLNGSSLAGRFAITVIDANNYDITALNGDTADASGAGGGAAILMFDDAVNLSHTMSFGAAFGRRNFFEFQALLANVAIQDSYFAMCPISHLWATHMKFNGLPAQDMPKDLSVYPAGGTTGNASVIQAYSSDETQVVKQMVLEYAGADGFAAPIRSGGPQPAFNAWYYNMVARGIIVFGGESAKAYFHSHSSEAAEPRTAWPMVVGDKFQAQVSEKTSWLPGGAI